MATTRNFQDMLNEYLPNSLLKEELIKRDYILNKVKKDERWKGGSIIVPFKAAGATSVKVGGLTESNDIAQSQYVRGQIDSYREVWGSMLFDGTDLIQHDGKIKESTFLRVLPDTIDDFMEYMKMVVSIQLGTGPEFARAKANGTAAGKVVVDRVDRFQLGQKSTILGDTAPALAVYVVAIDLNTSEVTFHNARSGGAAVNLSTYTTAENTRFYHDGVAEASDTFTSLKSAILSAANGGSASLHGKSKLAYPFLQALNFNGGAGGLEITSTNILEKIFDAYGQMRIKARGRVEEILMSYKNLAACMKKLEHTRGEYKVANDAGKTGKAVAYGWDTIEIMELGSGRTVKIVGIQEMSDSEIFLMDWSAVTFRSNGFIRKRTAPDGKQFYEIRGTSGYQYIVDLCLFGELEVKQPNKLGCIFGVNIEATYN